MSRVNKMVLMSAATGQIFTLAPVGAAAFNEIGYLKVTILKTGASAANFYVQPVYVAPGGTVPAAQPTNPAPSVGTAADFVQLVSGTDSVTVDFGQKFAPGYSPSAQGPPVATHLQVWCAADGALLITGQ